MWFRQRNGVPARLERASGDERETGYMNVEHADVVVVGSGIVGLAHAYAAARKGLEVVVLERSAAARGASIRNFGLIWPIGQPGGPMLEMALRSRELWLEVLEQTSLPHWRTGSLHLAYRADEEAVGREFADLGSKLGYSCQWMESSGVTSLSDAANPEGLRGALYSTTEMTVDPRAAMAKLPLFLMERYGVDFRFSTPALAVGGGRVETSRGSWNADHIIVCSGHDLESLYPEELEQAGLQLCKLQMMRTFQQPDGWLLGPALAGGLTMRYYPSFEICSNLEGLRQRITAQMRGYDRWGIHVMVSQTMQGEVTIGDSHEYGSPVDVFDKPEIDELILDYLHTMARFPILEIAQRWHGVYARHPHEPYVRLRPETGVEILTGLGGAGMTLSFGLAEKTIEAWG